jgi:predicted small metal-binding protein
MMEGQVLQKIIRHMHEDHGMKVIPADLMIKIKHSINNQNIVDNVSPGTATELLVAR